MVVYLLMNKTSSLNMYVCAYFLPTGDMHLRTLSLNSQLCSTVMSCTTQLKSAADETIPFGCYDYLSLYHPEEHTAVMELIAALQKGSVHDFCTIAYNYNNDNNDSLFRRWRSSAVALVDQSDYRAE